MKRKLRLVRLSLGIFYWLAAVLSVSADGFIIVHEPPPWPFPDRPARPVPPPWPRPQPWIPAPPPRVYRFAPLEVSYHHVNVRIQDQVAVTSVDQEFYNPNAQTLEGTYIFPIPKGAQINKFTMEIGGKTVEAELLAADKARRIYEDIVRKLKDPALLEYAGRDVFKVRIFPIEPHAKKHITVSYTQLLPADNGLVDYVYPLNTEKFAAQPIKDVSVKIELETQRALKSVYSPTHTVEIRRHGDNRATVGFEGKDIKPDTDLQLFYAMAKDDIGLNLMSYRTGGDDGFFLLLASPGVASKDTKVVPKDITFVLDTSGSMSGKKLAQAKKALQFCIDNLNEGDRFEIIRFSTETESLFDRLVEATAENRSRATDFVKDLKAIGGTALDDALQKAIGLRRSGSQRPYTVVFLTDGMPTVGSTDENEILGHVKKQLSTSDSDNPTRVFCFGIGTDVNTHLLDKVAEDTKAVSQYVLPEEDLEVKLSSFYAKIKEPVLSGLHVTFPEGIRATRLHPYPLPDLFRGEQLILAGRYSGSGSGSLVLEGTVNGRSKTFEYDARFPGSATEFDFIPRLWATRRVGYLLDEIRLHGENSELKNEVTDLARKYGIVTPYTAYLIYEDESQRQVPVAVQSLPQLRQDIAARDLSALAWSDSLKAKSGDAAVARSRYGFAMRSAEAPASAMAAGNLEAGRSLATIASPAAPAKPEVTATARRMVEYTQQTRFVQGRTFFLNEKQWVDAQVQKLPQAKHVRIQFNSPEYFDLIARAPEVSPILALGQNLQFVMKGEVYEIYD